MEATCRGDTHLVVGLDEDDPQLDTYLGLVTSPVEHEVRGGLRYVVPWINELSVPRTSDYRFIGHFGDDNLPHTDGWDVRIIQALGQAPFAFGEDLAGRPPGSLSCHIFTRSDVIATLGYFGPPQIQHMYVDVAWYAWGRACGIAYLPEVIIEHLHYSVRRSAFDETYAASYALSSDDLAAWHTYGHEGLNADIAKLGGKPFTPAELHDFNIALNIPPVWGAPVQ